MITFLKRHFWYLLIGVFGLAVAFGLYSLFGSTFQIGLNPIEFLIKVFAKLVYVGAAVMVTHFVIKKFFTTIYEYCRTDAQQKRSHFMEDWDEHFCAVKKKREQEQSGVRQPNDAVIEVPPLSPKIWIAIAVHVGIFIGICFLLALAF